MRPDSALTIGWYLPVPRGGSRASSRGLGTQGSAAGRPTATANLGTALVLAAVAPAWAGGITRG